MATTINEIHGRRLSETSAERVYTITGTTSEVTAHDDLLTASDATVDGLPRDDIRVDEIGDGQWEGTVTYVKSSSSKTFSFPAVGSVGYSFNTGGGTQHIKQSISTTNTYPATAPDCKGAIGSTPDSVEGCDITIPVFNFSVPYIFANGSVTTAYKQILHALTGKVNNAAYMDFAAGELLFLGAQGSKRDDSSWEVTFNFAGSPNQTGLTIGGITSIAKLGWDYLWIRYDTAVDTTSDTLISKPTSVHVEKVYNTGDFSTLGIT